MEKKVTIYDLAKKLGVSAATVSRALNKNPKISETMRKQVLKAAQEMGYEQNKLALALKSGISNSVGVIVPRINRSFFSGVIRGIDEELSPHGYHVIIAQSYDDETKEKENISTLLNAQVDGILMSISNATKDTEIFSQIVKKKKMPLIFFDRKKDIDGVSTITINDFEAGYEATKHLIDQGCKHIVHFAGDCDLEIYQDRSRGYTQALKDHGLEANPKYIIESPSTQEDGVTAAKKIMKMKPLPDGIFSASDYAAMGAIKEIRRKGYSVPEDIAVVGFSNEPFTKFMELSISSVDQFPMDMGKMAARVFLEQVNDANKVRYDQKVVLSPKLHVRKSSLRKK